MKLKDLPKKMLARKTLETEDPLQKVDELLEAKYRYNLYYFAHCLADLLYYEPTILDSKVSFAGFKLPEKYWDNLINELGTLKDTTLKRIQAVKYILTPLELGYYMPYEYEEPEELENYEIEWIKKEFKLNSYFKTLDKYIETLKSFKTATPTDKRGRQIRAKNLVALIWSYAMKKPDTKAYDWKSMADLFDWFLWNLKGTYYGDKLLPQSGEETFDAFNLKRVVLRLKANLKKNEFFKEKVKALTDYYFSEKDLDKMSTIDFTEKIEHIDEDYPLAGGKQYYGLYDKNLLIILPNGKLLPRPGRPPKREPRPKLNFSKMIKAKSDESSTPKKKT